MSKNRITQLIAMVVGLCCLLTVALLVGPINQQRQTLQIETGLELGEGMPPHVALATSALGSFRGLFVDILWYRANQLKEEGKFHEANTLSQWITTLQPRFQQVWSFHAWNMAYNISVATHTPEERWDWVNKGIRLLRDRGIPLNPRAIRLYRELSWIFFHKVGQFSDDAHWYYKRELAFEMQQVLGDLNRGGTTEQIIARFKQIVDMPDTIDDLLVMYPGVKPVLQRVKEIGYEPNDKLLLQIGRYLMLVQSLDAMLQGVTGPKQPIPAGIDPQIVHGLLSDQAWVKPVSVLVAYMRKRVLIEQYHMDPQAMLELMENFGPIDWRHPAAHGAYWARQGTKQAEDLRSNEDVDIINTYRQNIHSLQQLTRHGRISFDPVSKHLQMLPDPRFIPAYEKNLAEAEAAHVEKFGSHSNSYDAGHENFLLMASLYHYLYGDMDKAYFYFKRVRRLYGDKPHNVQSQRYARTVQDMVLFELKGNKDMMDRSVQFIDAMIRRSLEEGLVNGRRDIFERFLGLAKKMHEGFQKRGVVSTVSPQDRMKVLPWRQTLRASYISYMKTESVNPLMRARIWANTPRFLQYDSYDRLFETIQLQFTKANLDPALAFRPPPGLDEYRKKNHPPKDPKKNKADVDVMRQ